MSLPSDTDKLGEVMALLRAAHKLAVLLTCKSDDLESLISVAQSEAKRLQASTIVGTAKSGTIPLILTGDKSVKPKGSRS
jgi:hypothetical protein